MDFTLPALEAARSNLIATVRQHPFLKRCRNAQVHLPELQVFLVQQGLYSRYFTRYLCAMMANLKSNEDVLALAENLFEELGLTPDSPTPHSTIYRQMLEHFGLDLADHPTPLPGTTLLIESMFGHCRNHNPACGLGALCLGAEALVPSIYSDILTAFVGEGIDPGYTEFFRIHVECDDGHADTMRDIMVAMAQRDPAQLDTMIQSGHTLVRARMAFFDSIQAACTRRETLPDFVTE
jgi:pyrroloquinoline-quinone synthase